ncbi:MAG TPA: class I SAM-dependent methyltransferase, partial [Gemmatimonadaceae bacterium]|nr:class I SAM-dependent methyltransferase [Gemmatimonadaceae bacterium]
MPANQNLLLPTCERARGVTRGTLALHACPECGFVFNAAFHDDRLDYGASYENTQSESGAFAAYLAERVADVVAASREDLRTIVEVGCGKGVFLSLLVEAVPGSTGHGFDTSYEGPESSNGGRLRFHTHYFRRGVVHDAIDAVACRHVIEHIADPVAFLTSIREGLENPAARIFFETPCVDWILRNEVIWDFFYEHCSYFNPRSLEQAFARAGFDVTGVHHVFGGQYLWLEAVPGAARRSIPSDGGAVLGRCRAFAKRQASSI